MFSKLILLFLLLMCSPSWGAELLVIAVDSCADPLCNRKGDVISCREDGVDWAKEGSGYAQPMWKMVSIPGMTKAECEEKYLKPLTEQREVVVDGKVEMQTVVVRDRAVSIDTVVLDQMDVDKKKRLAVESKDVTAFKAGSVVTKDLAYEKFIVEAEKTAIREEI